MRIEETWGRIRGMRRRGWRPQLKVTGLKHLREALKHGKGAVLWVKGFCGQAVFKKALWQEGVPLIHLSREQHGAPQETWLGLQFVAPLYCRVEDRYLTERVVIPLDNSLGYLRCLQERLFDNGCVSIMAEHRGRGSVTSTFFAVQAEFATGAPSLAWKCGSVLLPVRTVREGFFNYNVVIEEPIRLDRSEPRKDFVKAAVREFTQRLELHIRERPAEWMGWVAGDFSNSVFSRYLRNKRRERTE